nr:hypothetical protein [Candidatus Sigynarchaeota archaeon]
MLKTIVCPYCENAELRYIPEASKNPVVPIEYRITCWECHKKFLIFRPGAVPPEIQEPVTAPAKAKAHA